MGLYKGSRRGISKKKVRTTPYITYSGTTSGVHDFVSFTADGPPVATSSGTQASFAFAAGTWTVYFSQTMTTTVWIWGGGGGNHGRAGYAFGGGGAAGYGKYTYQFQGEIGRAHV
mgnify:FL=1